ncbi:MAG: MBL fold metallo-hydrolase [Deltaproteobacteria bacterium]|nr:MBL fold metallo-hydrolase [Deltaproteobacteria bacterium]
MTVSVTFMGGVRTTTGSRYLLRAGNEKILIDCGLFEGLKELRTKNWEPFPMAPSKLTAVVLTHSQLENAGYLPKLIQEGFEGKVYCSEATKELCSIILKHNACTMNESLTDAIRFKSSKHPHPRPLYTSEDVDQSLDHFSGKAWEESFKIGNEFEVCLHYAGHILGASLVLVKVRGLHILFSANLGRLYDPLLLAPSSISQVDYLILESTYGNQLHPHLEPEKEIADSIKNTLTRKGVVIISASTTCRLQLLLYSLYELKKRQQIFNVPIYVDTCFKTLGYEIFQKYENDFRLPLKQIKEAIDSAHYIQSAQESERLRNKSEPMIIISGNEMATKGRILNHLKTFGTDAKNLILFTGFPTAGTRGAQLLSESKSIKIHGAYWPIRAEVKQIKSLSFHADYSEIIEWLRSCRMQPQKTFITHGEPQASASLREKIENEFHWKCVEPRLGETIFLDRDNFQTHPCTQVQ